MPRFGSVLRSAVVVFVAAYFALGFARLVFADDDPPASPPVEREHAARDVLVEVDHLEVCYHERFNRFSDRIAELIKHSRDVAEDPGQGSGVLWMASQGRFAVELSTSDDGQTYTQRITGDRIDSYLERDVKHDFIDYGAYGWHHVKDTCS